MKRSLIYLKILKRITNLLVIFNLILMFEIVACKQALFQFYSGYQIKEIPNITKAITLIPNMNILPKCLELCKDPLCSGVTFYRSTAKCLKNIYGRVELEVAVDAGSWILSMSFSYTRNLELILELSD